MSRIKQMCSSSSSASLPSVSSRPVVSAELVGSSVHLRCAFRTPPSGLPVGYLVLWTRHLGPGGKRGRCARTPRGSLLPGGDGRGALQTGGHGKVSSVSMGEGEGSWWDLKEGFDVVVSFCVEQSWVRWGLVGRYGVFLGCTGLGSYRLMLKMETVQCRENVLACFLISSYSCVFVTLNGFRYFVKMQYQTKWTWVNTKHIFQSLFHLFYFHQVSKHSNYPCEKSYCAIRLNNWYWLHHLEQQLLPIISRRSKWWRSTCSHSVLTWSVWNSWVEFHQQHPAQKYRSS